MAEKGHQPKDKGVNTDNPPGTDKWPMKIPLKHPIKIERDGAAHEISELQMSKLKGKHLKHVPAELTDGYFVVPLIAALTDLTEAEAGEMEIEDVMAVAEKLIPLLEGLPGIGKM